VNDVCWKFGSVKDWITKDWKWKRRRAPDIMPASVVRKWKRKSFVDAGETKLDSKGLWLTYSY